MPSEQESTPSDSTLTEQFLSVVAAVADGGLLMPAPFDLASSAALAANSDTGPAAEGMFAVTARRNSRYEVRITEIQDDISRDLVNTTCTGRGPLFALLDTVMDEIEARGTN